MLREKCIFVLLALALAGPLPARAEDDAEDDEKAIARKLADALGEEPPVDPPPPVVTFGTVVSARRQPERSFDSHRAVERYGPEELARGAAATVPQALSEMPGVMVQQTNRAGGAPYLRGMIGPRVLVLIDGVRLNNSTWRTGPSQYLNTFDPWTLQRLEVVRGPGSVLYGSDALGGVIQLFTRDPDRPPANGFSLHPFGGLRHGSADGSMSSRFALSTGYDDYAAIGGVSIKNFNDLRGGEDTGEQPFSGYSEFDADVKLKLRPASWVTLTGAYQSVRVADAGRFDNPDGAPEERKATFYDNERDLGYLKASGKLSRIATGWSLTLSYQRAEERRTSRRVPGSDLRFVGRPERARDEVHTLGASLAATSWLLHHTLDLTYGVDYYHDWVDSSGTFSDGATYGGLGLYMRLDYNYREVGPGDLRLFTGNRFSWFSADAPAVPGVGDVNYDSAGNVSSAGLQYLIADLLNLHLTYSQGFRAPNLQETASAGDTGEFFEIPNGDLEPEKSHTLELGVKARWRWIGVSAAYYFTFLNNVIVREDATWGGEAQVNGQTVKRRVNANSAQYSGVEASVRLTPLRSLSLLAHGTWTEGNVIGANDKAIPARRVPPFFGMLGVRFEEPRLGVFAEASLAGALAQRRLSDEDRQDSRIGPAGTDSWWTVNLRAGYALDDRNRLVLNLDNLLDRRYKTHGSGVYASGFNAVLLLQLGY